MSNSIDMMLDVLAPSPEEIGKTKGDSMKTTHVRTIEELAAGILGALAFEFTILMADLGYSTSSLIELNDSAPASAKKWLSWSSTCTGHSGTDTNNSGSPSASATTSPEER